MKQKKEKLKIPTSGGSGSMGSLAEILRNAGIAPTGSIAPAAVPPEENPVSKIAQKSPPAKRLRVRTERKHRGGKTVTIVEGFIEDSRNLETLLKRMKTALGCGGMVENGTLVLQGDIAGRVRGWIESNM